MNQALWISFFRWLQDTAWLSYIRECSYLYLVILSLHVAALVWFGGMVMVTDLRLLGIGLRGYSVAEVVNGLRGPKRFGFVSAVLSGVVLFASQAGQFADNRWFWAKIALLVLIGLNYLIFGRAVYHNTGALDNAAQIPGTAKLAAGLSLLLWTGVVCAGRGPATIKDLMHSMIDPNGDFVFSSVQEIADGHGAREKAPRTAEEWKDVRQHLAVLSEAPELLAGRRAARPRDRSRNPKRESEPEEIQKAVDADPPALIRRARKLQNAARVAMQAVDAKDKTALLQAIDGIDKACESCHLRYWYPNDKRAQEAAKEDGITEF